MVRAVLYLLASIFLISLVRAIIGILARAFTNATMGPSAAAGSQKGAELRQCSICGIYAPPSAAVKVRDAGVFVCSEACAAKYRG